MVTGQVTQAPAQALYEASCAACHGSRGEGTARRQASGLDLRRFQLVGAVLDSAGLGLGRADVFGAVAGGARLDDPACDLAVAAAVASAAAGVPAPSASAFVGEIGLTGVVRPAPGMAGPSPKDEAYATRASISASSNAGLPRCTGACGADSGIRPVRVRHVMHALTWAAGRPAGQTSDLPP